MKKNKRVWGRERENSHCYYKTANKKSQALMQGFFYLKSCANKIKEKG